MANKVDNKSLLRVGTMLRNIYRIDGYLASGGFGNTYVASNVEFDEQVAIKEFFMKDLSQRDDDGLSISVPNPHNVEQFEKLRTVFKREAKRVRKLGREINNPHIVKVYDIFEENNTAYYVMQYVNGRSFNEILRSQKNPCDSTWLLDVFLPQVLDALEPLHKNKLWHLDIKPANIMADSSGNIMLIDFGSSKQIDPNSGDPDTTSSLLLITRPYAPIELKDCDYKKIGPWTDLYSLGATLYNLATMQNPPRTSDMTVENESAFNFLPGTNEVFKKLVMWMMNTNISNRPKSVDEVKSFLLENKDKNTGDDSSQGIKPLLTPPDLPGGDDDKKEEGQQPPVPEQPEKEVQLKRQPNRNVRVVSQPENDPRTDYTSKKDSQQEPPMPPQAPPASESFPSATNSEVTMPPESNGYGDNSTQEGYLEPYEYEHEPHKSSTGLYMLLAFLATVLVAGALLYFFWLRGSDSGTPDNNGGSNDTTTQVVSQGKDSLTAKAENAPVEKKQEQKDSTADTTSAAASDGGVLSFFGGSTDTVMVERDTVITCEIDGEKVSYTYRGQMVKGKPNGMGHGVYADGTYDGPYKDGEREGAGGKFVYTSGNNNGDTYFGEFDDDRFEGKGEYSSRNHTYVGTFDDGKPEDGVKRDAKGNVTDKWVNGNHVMQDGQKIGDGNAMKPSSRKLLLGGSILLLLIAAAAIFFIFRSRNTRDEEENNYT